MVIVRRTIKEILEKRKKLDVLLINPPVTKRMFREELTYIERNYWNVMDKFGTLWGDHKLEPNLGLLYIASSLIERGVKTDLIDLNIIDHYYRDNFGIFLPIKKIEDTIRKKNAKIIGISGMTVNFGWVEKIAAIIKRERPDTFVVVGGLHPTFNADDILRDKNIDFVIRGEGEASLPELLDHIEDKKSFDNVRGLSYRKNNRVYHNKDRPLLKNLEKLPFPSFELLPKETNPLITRIYTSRGCRGKCKYCIVNNFFCNKIRFRKPENVLEEILHIQEKFKPDMFLIGDLTFFDNKKLALELCGKLIKEKVDIRWWCQTRVDKINNNVCKIMKKAGCYQAAVGVESASELENDSMNKNINLSKSIYACKKLKNNKIKVQTYWMFGLPNDTYKSSVQTIELIKKFIRDRLTDVTHIAINVPYPGTEPYEEPEKFGIEILNRNFSDYWMNCDDVSSGLPVYRTKYLSEIEIYILWFMALKEATNEYEKRLSENLNI